MNRVVLSGNLGNDPEVNYYGEGEPIASFSLAFRTARKKTGWIRVVAFQRLAETVQRYLHKGAKVAVIGTLDQHKWETDQGVQKSAFQITASSLEFIKTDGRGFEDSPLPEDEIPF
jgi:single-strand DNA-binding protein